MFELSQSEIFLYIGIAGMATAITMALLCIIVFKITGRRIEKKLEEDYGKKHG